MLRNLSFLATLLLTGCTILGQDPIAGYLVTHTTVPYTADLHDTPFTGDGRGNTIVRIRKPFSGYGIYTELNSNAIGDIGREHGLETVYFADLQTFSLFSVWRSQTLILYGE